MDTKILQLLEEGKSIKEVFTDIAKSFPDSTQEEIVAAVEVAAKAVSAQKAYAAKQAEVEAKKKAEADKAELETKLSQSVDSVVEKKVNDALSKIDLKDSSAPATEFKSFMGDYVTVGSNWKASFGEFVKACATNDFARARELSNSFESRSVFATKALTGDAVTGSYAVPDEFSDKVFAISQAESGIFARALKMPTLSDKKYMLTAGDVTFTELASQSTQITESTPTLGQAELDIIDAAAIGYYAMDLMEDSNISITNMVMGAYGRGLSKYIKQTTAVGNVATTGDKINGIFSTSGISSVAADGGAITYDGLVDMWKNLEDSFMSNAHWEMNKIELAEIMKIKDANGQPIFVKDPTGAFPGFIFGYPVYLNNQMPATLDSSTGARTGGSTATILFGDASQTVIGMKGGLRLKYSEHLKLDYNQAAFMGLVRWGMVTPQPTAWVRMTGITR